MAQPRELGALWVGGRLSWLEYLCLSSFVARGQPVTLFTYDDAGPTPEGVIRRDGRGILDTGDFLKYERKDSYALFADLFRVHMVARCPGMIWVDTDTYCHAPITLRDEYVFGVENDSGQLANGVFGAPAESDLLQQILEFMSNRHPIPPFAKPRQIEGYRAAHAAGQPVHVSRMPWGTWGPQCLTWFAARTGTARLAQPRSVFYPVPYGNRRVFLRDRDGLGRFLTPASTGINVFASNKAVMADRHGGLPPPGSFFGSALKELGIDPAGFPIVGKGRRRVSPDRRRFG